MPNINEYIKSLKASPRLGGQVVFHTLFDARPARWALPADGLPEALRALTAAVGIDRLYRHQAQAIDHIRAGRHVVVATPTASGKTLIYNLSFLERFLARPDARALYLFPLKALAQDQLLGFNRLAAARLGLNPTAAIYDGDTSAWQRRKLREAPPNVVLTNPEMLHLAVLAHHEKWAPFLSRLEQVVVDEVHTYRGVMGSHMAQVFRRLRRVCGVYGAQPTFIFNSATIANPAELSGQLTGLEVHTVTASGAPRGRRHALFIDPLEGPAQTAILLLKAALQRGLRTIVYTQSRKMTELIALWAGSQAGPFASRISAYRAGFLPEERRDIEARLVKGDLLAVISTSALELGIDIGDLDLCILVGYPGTVMATWQRGGRVGRSGQDSALVLVAGEDALDQYFMRNPQDFIDREPEAAVVNPYNPEILARHMVCAAAERPLRVTEALMCETPVQAAVARLESRGELLRSADGSELYASRKAPHRRVDLRGSGSRYAIVCSRSGESRGEVDGFRAFRETHPGAVYLHRGNTYLVEDLDLETRTVKVVEAQVDYYTRVRATKQTEILEVTDQRAVLGTGFFTGRLKVTEQVVGYERWRIRAKKRLNRVPLDLPPMTFETEGLWFQIPVDVQRAVEARWLHFMGGIHAVEHAAIGIFPLLVLTDRNDLGGISIPFHPQVGSAAVFIYDGLPGGAGLCRQAYRRAEALLRTTHKAIATCPCETGCPSCVHSPKCGSGNRPIDKAAALFILEALLQATAALAPRPAAPVAPPPLSPPAPLATAPPAPVAEPSEGRPVSPVPDAGRPSAARYRGRLKRHGLRPRGVPRRERARPQPSAGVRASSLYFGVFDVETRRSAQEVGGWHRADRMGISAAVLYDSHRDAYLTFEEDRVPELVDCLTRFDLVVGFNVKRFDYRVLSGYSDVDFGRLPTLDILEEIHRRLGYRLSLDHLARVTLGRQKSADGLQALQWWKEGRIDDIIRYCRQDVEITHQIFAYGKANGYLLFNNKAGNTVRVPVSW